MSMSCWRLDENFSFEKDFISSVPAVFRLSSFGRWLNIQIKWSLNELILLQQLEAPPNFVHIGAVLCGIWSYYQRVQNLEFTVKYWMASMAHRSWRLWRRLCFISDMRWEHDKAIWLFECIWLRRWWSNWTPLKFLIMIMTRPMQMKIILKMMIKIRNKCYIKRKKRKGNDSNKESIFNFLLLHIQPSQERWINCCIS
jgi:hypothetical protein